MSVAAQRKYHLVEADETIHQPLEDQSEMPTSSYEPEVESDSGATLDTCSAVGTIAAGPPTRMLVGRSLSSDGQVDSVSVTIDLAIDGLTALEIKAKGLKALRLESEIAQEYFAGSLPLATSSKAEAKTEAKTDVADEERFAVPARLLDVGKTKNNTYFINVKVGGKKARLFGTARQLVVHLAGIGQDLTPEAIYAGLQLDYACLAVTELGGDGHYLNVIKLLPAA